MEATWNGALFSAATIRLPLSTQCRLPSSRCFNGSHVSGADNQRSNGWTVGRPVQSAKFGDAVGGYGAIC
jgi:hypothetical protein